MSAPTKSPAVSTAAHSRPDAHAAPRPLPPHLHGPVLLAVSDDSRSHAPAVIAEKIAERFGVPLMVVTVVEPSPVYTGPTSMAPLPLIMEEERWNAQNAAVTAHMAATGVSRPWQLQTRYGSIAAEVAVAARELGAGLIVVGAAPHQRTNRMVAGVRAAQILRHATCPVLSVDPGMRELPRRIVCGIDFGAPSLYAAEVALALGTDDAHVVLVNDPLPFHLPLRQDKSGALTGGNVDELLDKARAVLEPYRPAGVTIRTQVESGVIKDALLERAEAEDVQLIAVGTHGPGVFERFALGSVATSVLHLASVSVLAAPRPPFVESVRFTLGLLGTAVLEQPGTWAEVLDAFSRTNAGRRVTLEVDDRAVGAQLQANHYVFRGIAYDEHDQRVECMLGKEPEGVTHLTRTIEDVQGLALHARGDRHAALEIRHGDGHTLLRFV